MKSIIGFIICLAGLQLSGLQAQLGINPQIGINFTQLSEEPKSGFDVEGRGGIYAGVDLRLGSKFYLQPGLFVVASKTVYEYKDSLFINASEVTRFGAKLKGLLGYKIIDSSFKLRLMAGPTYNFLLSIDEEQNPYFDEDDFNKGTFNLDFGVGVDILFLTAELGYSYGFSDVFERDISEVFDDPPKYQSWIVTVGIIFGD